MRYFLLIIPLIIFSTSNALAQKTRTIRGYIIDEKNRNGIPNAQISSNHANSSTLSNEEGAYSIEILETETKDTLKISHEGHKTVFMPLKKSRDGYFIYMDRADETSKKFNLDEDVKELSVVNIKGNKIKLINPFFPISLDMALTRAQVENKKVLVYVSAKWCGQCKLLDKTLFQHDTVIHRLKNDVIPVKIDIDTYEGEKLKKEFQIAGYPTFLMLTPDKSVTNRNVGIIFNKHDYDDPKGILEFIDDGITADEKVEVSQEEIEILKRRKEFHERLRFGVKFASHINATPTLGRYDDYSSSFETGIFIHLNKGRFMFRPGISYLNSPKKRHNLSSILIPIDLGYSFYKGSTFGLPSEFKALITPYYQHNFNADHREINVRNIGMRYGVDFQIGGDSAFGFTLAYQHAFRDYYKELSGLQDGFHFGLYFTVPSP
ncbi:thioredoxin family protein [Sediminitomix flava]|uniref:Carboxypeptidase-like protein n=1 Tax=Sediminitomix flava TaxID=379075 RepID=A0A315Z0L1_SEDFL|nr:thioredoxin family protein [Sediminitomix flava]PWJ36173.1 carboxypeptidase-like protein [Sediminitomix flava]